MRKFILLFLIIILSCCSKKDEIESIEIMSYYYDFNENQTGFKTEPVTYSIIDENGNVETIQKTPSAKSKYLKFKSTVDKTIIDKISSNNKDKNDNFYKDQPKESVVEIYCGPIIRIKIKYKNQTEITFNLSDYKTNPKHKDFIKLQNLIKNNYAEKKFNQIENPTELESKLKDFEKYSLNKDTLELPFPPMPKPSKNVIKFTK